MEELAFMVFGLGFFMFVIHYICKDSREERNFDAAQDREQYSRRLNEQREFGYQAIKHPDPSQKEPKHKN